MSDSDLRKTSSAVLSHAEYVKLAEFRYHLARFLRRRKDAARAEGLRAQQYELLLAIAGLSHKTEPTIRELAAQLRLEHHTVVELADRLEKRGLLKRAASRHDRRAVLLQLTHEGTAALNKIVRYSFDHLREEAPALIRSLQRILVKPSRS